MLSKKLGHLVQDPSQIDSIGNKKKLSNKFSNNFYERFRSWNFDKIRKNQYIPNLRVRLYNNNINIKYSCTFRIILYLIPIIFIYLQTC